MSDRIIGLRLTDEEIRKLHRPPGQPSNFGPCLCPVCRPPEPEEPEKETP